MRTRARATRGPFIALYVGGMGSRKQNFYNSLVQRYGFEAEAKVIQDLYLEGKREEAMAAIPEKLIDTVSLCGPPDACASGSPSTAMPAWGRSGITPLAFTREERLEQLRLVRRAGRLPTAADMGAPHWRPAAHPAGRLR